MKKYINKIILTLFTVCAFSFLTAQDVTVNVSDATGTQGDTVSVSFTVDNFTDMVASQMTITWDSMELSFVTSSNYGISGMNSANFGISNVSSGYINFIWDDPQLLGQTLPEGGELFSIDFKLNGAEGSSSEVSISETPTEVIFLDSGFGEHGYSSTAGIVTVMTVVPLGVNLINSTNVLCNGDSNGAITVTGTGGTEPYSYVWSSGQTTASITDLPAGSYTVSVTDDDGNTVTTTTDITEPTAISATLGTTEDQSGNDSGSAVIAVSGGTPPYEILWSNGQTGNAATELQTGNYSVTITDANNCEVVENFNITSTEGSMEKENFIIDLFPNPAGQELSIMKSKNQGSDTPFLLQDAMGRTISSFEIPAGQTVYKLDITNLANGIYWLRSGNHTSSFLKQ